MSAIELRELIPVHTPVGDGYALIVELGQHDNMWTVILDSGGVVTFQQSKITVWADYTHERGINDERMRQILKDRAERRT